MKIYDELLILPFDHRGSLLEKLLGVRGREPTLEEAREVSGLKRIVYDGFKLSLKMGVPEENSGILVDEQFGSNILAEAKKEGITTACSIEKSGQDVFDFEYTDWQSHIEKTSPTFCKVLVRLNPEADAVANRKQLERLKLLNDFLKDTNRGFLFELLVPPTAEQLAKLNGNKEKFDSDMRPILMVSAMKQIQGFGIEPDIWKLEGVDKKKDAENLIGQAKSDGRKAGIITLGRGENKEKVMEWLRIGAKISGVIGFAVGRTVFWDAIKGYKEKNLSREKAVDMVANNYKELVDLWQKEKRV